jgi:hypothetical protein
LRSPALGLATRKNSVEDAIVRRIENNFPDMITKFGLLKIKDAAREIADMAGDVEEIGSSDVSHWTRQTIEHLGASVTSRWNVIAQNPETRTPLGQWSCMIDTSSREDAIAQGKKQFDVKMIQDNRSTRSREYKWRAVRKS